MNTPIGSPLQLQGQAIAAPRMPTLTQSAARPLFSEAVARWQSALGDFDLARRLGSVRIEIRDLPGTLLGLASGSVIFVDSNAVGHGWFLDSTPWDDSEFSGGVGKGPAKGHVDLLSVLEHELGHILGFEHASADDHHANSVMSDSLPVGVRRLSFDGLTPDASSDQAVDALWAQYDPLDHSRPIKRKRG